MGFELWSLRDQFSSDSPFFHHSPLKEHSSKSQALAVPQQCRLLLVIGNDASSQEPLLSSVLQALGIKVSELFVTSEREFCNGVSHTPSICWFAGVSPQPMGEGQIIETLALESLRQDWQAKRALWRELRELDV
ncbi:DNA polymerase III subunit psi [Dongshaea marina]|uniref:DNA polymerase III subunit psi n=1 Tax=Dongshaea marina TaxID=2047966 RepID=UPI00131EEC87|nr:DNA polymerase III subunit psi [Dongshaea marina]